MYKTCLCRLQVDANISFLTATHFDIHFATKFGGFIEKTFFLPGIGENHIDDSNTRGHERKRFAPGLNSRQYHPGVSGPFQNVPSKRKNRRNLCQRYTKKIPQETTQAWVRHSISATRALPWHSISTTRPLPRHSTSMMRAWPWRSWEGRNALMVKPLGAGFACIQS